MQIGTTRGRIAAGIALVAVAALVVSTGLAAQGRGGRDGFGGALRYLDLTEDQRTSIRTTMREYRESGADTRQALRAAQRNFRDAVTANEVDEPAIRAAAAEAASLQADAAVLRAEMRAAVLALLTADQRAELERLRDNARENRHDRRGRRGRSRD
ncbi:MAG: periplasmic heavy metal sensor [Acidobacteria bacterium]|nr:periplasmic heavy metal sensor [Acidobacteriota bacterium]